MPSIRIPGPFGVVRRALLALLVAATGAAVPAAAQEAPGLVVRQLDFKGNDHIPSEVLAASIATTNSSWFARVPLFRGISFIGEKRYLDEQQFRRDVLRLLLLYRRSGYLEVTVDTLVQRTASDAWVTFDIDEGPPVLVTSITITGLEGFPEAEKLQQDLPLKVGAPFDRLLLQTTADSLVRRLRDRGHPSASVYPGFTVERAARVADVSFEVVPGAAARVGPVEVTGVGRLDTSLVRNLLAIEPNQPYSQENLVRSQLSLYRTDLFRFASVEVDSSFAPGDTVVPVRVNVSEGPLHRIRGGAGYGTDDTRAFSAGMSGGSSRPPTWITHNEASSASTESASTVQRARYTSRPHPARTTPLSRPADERGTLIARLPPGLGRAAPPRAPPDGDEGGGGSGHRASAW